MSGRIQTVSGPCDRKRLQPFVGVGHMAMMAFNTDIMQEVGISPRRRSGVFHFAFSLIHYIIDDEYTINRQCC